ncbi:MAG: hypothetical protein WC707_03800 [Candidatus Babeliaceae bacterium]|jgi:hypothetical protein
MKNIIKIGLFSLILSSLSVSSSFGVGFWQSIHYFLYGMQGNPGEDMRDGSISSVNSVTSTNSQTATGTTNTLTSTHDIGSREDKKEREKTVLRERINAQLARAARNHDDFHHLFTERYLSTILTDFNNALPADGGAIVNYENPIMKSTITMLRSEEAKINTEISDWDITVIDRTINIRGFIMPFNGVKRRYFVPGVAATLAGAYMLDKSADCSLWAIPGGLFMAGGSALVYTGWNHKKTLTSYKTAVTRNSREVESAAHKNNIKLPH